MALSFVAAGVAESSAGGVTGTIVPALPAGVSQGDLLVAIVAGRGAMAFTASIGWDKNFHVAHATSGINTLAMFTALQTGAGDAGPTISWTAGVVNGDVIAQVVAIRPTDATKTPIVATLGTKTDNASGANIGPITAPAGFAITELLLVIGHKADDWTSVTALAGDAETWAEIGEPDSAAGDDAGLVWNYAILAGAPPAITDKTFTVTGGASAAGVGIMISFSEQAVARRLDVTATSLRG